VYAARDSMAEPPTVEPPAAASGRFGTRWLGVEIEWTSCCPSTNDAAIARGRSGARAGLVIVADEQTAGRGRLGRAWHSPAGENLYLSMLLRPSRPAHETPPLTLLVGAAVARTLAAYGVRPRLKWPNDVELVDAAGVRRKVAGILTETATSGERVEQVVVGVGLNVNAGAFPPELAARAISLRQALGRALDRRAVLGSLLRALEPLLDEYERRGPAVAVAAFEPYAAFPERCRIAGAGGPPIEGVAVGLGSDGDLTFRGDDGRVHRVVSGELLP
jgi:BirA family transcriptional regulator, biotin operon repressor / biotin---[acetyl-CoA-carboxylase] ligase